MMIKRRTEATLEQRLDLLSDEIEQVRDIFHALSQRLEVLGKEAEALIALSAEKEMHDVETWLRALPLDLAIWDQANMGLLSTIWQERLERALLRLDSLHLWVFDEPLADLFWQGRAVLRFFRDIFGHERFFCDVPLRVAIPLHPDMIASILRMWMIPQVARQPRITLINCDTPVLYHPVYTIDLLYSFARGLLPHEVSIIMLPAARYLHIEIRGEGVHLTPHLWQRLIEGLSLNSLETLREMGGEIEPLVWDEGQGEGIIVRLPWATLSEERG